MHKPTIKKQPKKYTQQQRAVSAQRVNFIQKNKQTTNKKITQKNNIPIIPKPNTQKIIPSKLQQVQKKLSSLSNQTNNPKIQKMLLDQIMGIKEDIREIKKQIGLDSRKKTQQKSKYLEQQQQQQVEQNIVNMIPKSSSPQLPIKTQKIYQVQTVIQQKNGIQYVNYTNNKNKQMIDIGKIQPYMKQFKLQASKKLQPIYYGYHKKSSKPIVIKYCLENQTMELQINLYQKLWKNIVKAKKICINKIYDLNQPLANYILALQMNKAHLKDIQMPPSQILADILRALQFFHQCGYLYRNLHPQHVMMSFQNNIVLLGLSLMKRFTDIKGKLIQVKGNPAQQGINQFVSNARLRGLNQSRKDDLQTIGYIGLYLYEGRVPWTIQDQLLKRSKVTLQQLFGKQKGLFQFMMRVHKMTPDQQPNYDQLYNVLLS